MPRSPERPTDKRPALNLLPVMNLVTILIPLLLMSAQLVRLAVVDSTVPAIVHEQDNHDPEQAAFQLSLAITQQGFQLLGVEDIFDASQTHIPCSGGRCTASDAYDYAALNAKLSTIKAAHPDASSIILVPDEHVRYDVLVGAMDASRTRPDDSDLFPNVTIAGGVSG